MRVRLFNGLEVVGCPMICFFLFFLRKPGRVAVCFFFLRGGGG